MNSPPKGVTEPPSEVGWYAAVGAVPLSELAGGSSSFSWGVRVDRWDTSCLTVGVAYADAMLVAPGYGVCEKAFGVDLQQPPGSSPIPVHNRGRAHEAEGWKHVAVPLAPGTVQVVRLTANLTDNTLSAVLEHVPQPVAGEELREEEEAAGAAPVPVKRIEHSSWIMTVPDLARRHVHAAGGCEMRLTLMP